MILLIGLTGSAALWEDRSVTHEVIRDNGIFELPKAQGFHLAALLHITCAVALLAHIIVPRRWLIRVTGELVESTGRSLRHRIAHLPAWLTGIACLLLAVAFAGPRIGDATTEVHREGIAIEIAIS